MPRIDFYLTDDAAPNAVTMLACRLTEKAFLHGHRVYLHAASADQAQALDDLLWTFKQGSFLPHARLPLTQGNSPPILIGDHELPADADLLINLTAAVLPFHTRFARVAELVGPNETDRQQARERYRRYRDGNCELHTHNLHAGGTP